MVPPAAFEGVVKVLSVVGEASATAMPAEPFITNGKGDSNVPSRPTTMERVIMYVALSTTGIGGSALIVGVAPVNGGTWGAAVVAVLAREYTRFVYAASTAA
jgi:hypothetical protein